MDSPSSRSGPGLARLVLLDSPARPGSPWLEWVKRHGIDPHRVLVPGWIRCSDVARTVTYTTKSDTERVAIVETQLEAPAMPFPVSEEFTTLTPEGEFVTMGPALEPDWPGGELPSGASLFRWLQS